MINPPAGKKLLEIFSQNFSVEDVLKRLKKKCVVIKFSESETNAWMIIKNKKKVFSAYFKGEQELTGLMAIPEIQKLLKRNCKVSVYELNEMILPIFAGMYPSVVVDKDVSAAIFGARIKDETSISDQIQVAPEQFTPEWEEEEPQIGVQKQSEQKQEEDKKQEKTKIAPPEEEEEFEDEIVNAEVSDSIIESIKNTLTREDKPETDTVDIASAVINFHDFITSLSEKKFSGIVKGYDETIEMTAYLINGDIVAAIVKDESVVMKGNSPLLYFDTPAKVFVESKPPEEVCPPEDAFCEVDKDAKNALYRSI